MKYGQMVETSNVRKFKLALGTLMNRGPGMEGMGLLWGRPGEGKSTVVAHAVATTRGHFLRANAAWSMTSLLQSLMNEMGLPVVQQRARMVEQAVESLMLRPRPIFIDEADYLLRSKGDMLDVLRDVYDLSQCPVVLIGMEEFAKKVTVFGSGRFRRRITQWVEFAGLTAEDTRLVVDTLSDVALAEDLFVHLHRQCEANIGRIVIGLSRIEAWARSNEEKLGKDPAGRPLVTLAGYGKGTALYLSDPSFGRKVAA